MSNDFPPSSDSAAESRILAIGAVIGRFRVEALLGTGGMGEVYRVWDSALERSVALKALHPGGAGDTGAVERFRREALALAQLNHPGVCHIHDWVDGPQGAFIAMELVEGSTLDQAELSTREKLQVIRAVAHALEAAHAKGLVHRDLKPSNIMVVPRSATQPLHVKVLDFGLARLGDGRASDDAPARPAASDPAGNGATHPPPSGTSGRSWERLTQAGTFMGSPGYASPEQIQGQAAGSSSDVFSLGVVAWELLAGEHPFPGEGRARLQATLAGDRREWKTRGLPSGTADLLRAMLEPHPFKRPTAGRVVETLDRLLRPRTLLRWTAVGTAAALAGGLGVHLFLNRGAIADLTRERPARLAVMPFLNATGDPRLDAATHLILPEILETALSGHPKLAPLDADTLGRARASLHLAPRGALARDAETHLAAALGAQLTLRGKLARNADGEAVLTYELVDAKGRVRRAGELREPGDRPVVALPLARRLTAELVRAAGASSSTSLPALREEILDAYARGAELMDRGLFKEAAPAFLAAATLAPDFAPAVLGYARCLAHLTEAPAAPVFQWARWAARAHGDRLSEMKALHYLSGDQAARGEWEASKETGRATMALAQALGQTAFEAGVHLLWGMEFQRLGKLSDAEAEYRKSLDLYQGSGDALNATHALNNLAVVERSRGNLPAAEAHYLNALKTVRAHGDRWGEALLTGNLGDLALAQEGGLDRADAFYRQTRDLQQTLGDEAGLAVSFMGLASVAQARGDLDRAQEMGERFLEQARKTRLRPKEGLALYNLGEIHRTAGRYVSARGFYAQSLALHQELGDASMEAHCLAGEAECFAREGRRALGRSLLERSRARSAEETPYILRAQAWLARSEGRTEEAQALFAKALAGAKVQAPEIVRELTAAR
ncbi:serine/threonine-protein kinase [Geothrix sp. 21YS21S-4]|uniref:serine/threonine-protein kinase n=1 Tax=Geothrix sp. 21YS21S-4 TaxID=3068889 RepID=UPI0027BAF7DC|nr:serine/threonine-protein kinase [Geothrix sp. 21YS21S-4]